MDCNPSPVATVIVQNAEYIPATLSGASPRALEHTSGTPNCSTVDTVVDHLINSDLPCNDQAEEASRLSFECLGSQEGILSSIFNSLIAEARVEIRRQNREALVRQKDRQAIVESGSPGVIQISNGAEIRLGELEPQYCRTFGNLAKKDSVAFSESAIVWSADRVD